MLQLFESLLVQMALIKTTNYRTSPHLPRRSLCVGLDLGLECLLTMDLLKTEIKMRKIFVILTLKMDSSKW